MLPPSTQNQEVSSPGLLEDYAAPPSQGSRRFFVFLKRYWWIPTLTLLLSIGGAIAYIVWAPPVYVSQAIMWETEKLHLSEGALFTDDAQTYIGTQIELLKSGKMWQQAIERLEASGTNNVPLDKDGAPLDITLKFTEAPRSSVFAITASSANQAFSQRFLDALMAEYIEYKRSVRKSVSGQTAESISRQVESYERDLKTAQDALTVFQQTNNLAILQEEGTIAGGYLAKLQTELSDLHLESQLLQARAVEEEAAAPGNNSAGVDPVDLMKNLESPGQSSSANNERLTPFQEVEILKIQREKLSTVLRPKHPRMVALNEEIARGEKLIDLFRTQNHDQLVASQEAVKMKIESVVASIKQWDAKVVEANNRIAEAERLKLDVTRSQSLYDKLSTLLQNVDISRNTDLETLASLGPASTAKRTYTLDLIVSVLAVIVGLGSGAGIVYRIESRDDRFTSVVEVNATLGDAVVGLLPEVARNGKGSMPLLELNDPRHGYAESFRSLRSALFFLPTDGERPKILLVTSARPGEGKSTISANLARTLALSGSRVLLVDGDLRKGHLHHMLNMQSKPGLSELLSQTCDPNKVIQRDSLQNFAFISSGARFSNPGDLFLRSELEQLLARWRREFDYVIIDSSPLFAADDTSCLAPKVDGTLFVVRRGHSSAHAVSEAVDMLAQRQARVLGVIFNGADTSSRNYHYYKYEEYNPPAKTA
ncbi:MAG TPA: polysaccharide biosynthesis tyrosine autokinase [Candidatus Baltobacteraceae bacterium]|jgi:capsular exopolysaccharide synthesis family protein|nr:polysaccharide biosynthesis tyrosine autokinase [Candidatus Baltobacteraceae bacterium]